MEKEEKESLAEDLPDFHNGSIIKTDDGGNDNYLNIQPNIKHMETWKSSASVFKNAAYVKKQLVLKT